MEIKFFKGPNNKTTIILNDNTYSVPHHWFWPEFANGWEPQTFSFFKRNLKEGTTYLDIGGWVGPTALMATELGAAKVVVVEPNPINFSKLLQIQFGNIGFFERWTLLNLCVSSHRGLSQIGPLEGVLNSSSATNIRDQNGVEVMSVLLEDVVRPLSNISLIKIDIEGAEELVVGDFSCLLKTGAAIWLSLHPPFYKDKQGFANTLSDLRAHYILTDHEDNKVEWSDLENKILSVEEKPIWGTPFGNFFEIGLIPK